MLRQAAGSVLRRHPPFVARKLKGNNGEAVATNWTRCVANLQTMASLSLTCPTTRLNACLKGLAMATGIGIL